MPPIHCCPPCLYTMRVAVGLVPAYYRLVNFQQARDDWLSAEPQSEQESYYALSSPCQLSTELFGTAHPCMFQRCDTHTRNGAFSIVMSLCFGGAT